ncbi:MAG: FecR domain-containing protein [bacterium]
MPDLLPYNLIARYLANELSPAQAREFELWRSAAPENRQLLQELEKIWHATRPVPAPAEPDLDQAWHRLRQHLKLQEQGASVLPLKPPIAQQPRPMRWPAPRAWLAAAAVLLLGISLYLIPQLRQEPAWSTTITHNSQQLEITLADGSRVRMNSGSKLQFPRIFTDSLRQVFLEGEAFFQVTPATKPFVVVTPHARRSLSKEGRPSRSISTSPKRSCLLQRLW